MANRPPGTASRLTTGMVIFFVIIKTIKLFLIV